MTQAARRAEDEFREAFDRTADFVWRVLARHGVPEAVRPDLVQEAFAVLHRRWDEVATGARRSFLYGVCRRLASDWRRRAHVRREVGEASAPEPSSDSTPELEVQRVRRARLVRRLLDELGERKREVLVLHELEGWTMKEVARSLEIPLKTAYGRLYAGRRELAALWAERAGGRS